MAATVSGRRVAIAVLVIGFGAGALASWFMLRARPVPGPFIDAVATPDGALVVRHEAKSDRAFVELWIGHGEKLARRWSGLTPRYAGHPGMIAAAATRSVATVRVIRGGRPQVFAFDLVHGAKLASFELDQTLPDAPSAWTLPTVGTVGADSHAIEALGTADGGAALIAVDLDGRRLTWRRTLPWQPARVWIADGKVGAATADGAQQAGFDLASGEPTAAPPAPPAELAPGLTYDAARRELRAAGGQTFALPADAVEPRPYHVGLDVLYIVTPRVVQARSVADLSLRASS